MTATALLGLPPTDAPADLALVAYFRRAIATGTPISAADPPRAEPESSVAALVAVVPDALVRHRAERIPERVTAATLLDVGRKHALYGVETVLPWVLSILRGDVVSAGRLQVERHGGHLGHALHVPETGPLSPASVDESLRTARRLTGAARFSCTSWLLDPVIVDQLPESNIAAFARRFDLVSLGEEGDAASTAVCKFVFRRPLSDVLDPELVVPRSRLERLVASRLRAGTPWREPVGVLRP